MRSRFPKVLLWNAFIVVVLLSAACAGGGGGEAREGTASGQASTQNEQSVQVSGGEMPGETEPGSNAPEVKDPVHLGIGTPGQGTAHYQYAATLSQYLGDLLPKGSTIEVLPYSGGVGNPSAVADTKDMALAFSTSATDTWAYQGRPPYEKPLKDLRILADGLDQYYLAAISPVGSPFDSLQEIADKQLPIRITSLPKGSIGDLSTWLILGAYGITEESIKEWGGSVTRADTGTSISMLRDRRADLWFQATVLGHPSVTELAQTADVRFLEVADEALAKLGSQGLTPATLPAGSFRGQDEEVRLPGFHSSLIVDASMDDALAYTITKALIENGEAFKSQYKSMDRFIPEKAWEQELRGEVPLHPGAEQFYKNAGMMP